MGKSKWGLNPVCRAKVVDIDSAPDDVSVTATAATDDFVKKITFNDGAGTDNLYTMTLKLHEDGADYSGEGGPQADITVKAVDNHKKEATFTFKLVIVSYLIETRNHFLDAPRSKDEQLRRGDKIEFSTAKRNMELAPHVTITAARANAKVRLEIYGAGGGGTNDESYLISGGNGGAVDVTYTFKSKGDVLYITAGGGGGGYFDAGGGGHGGGAGSGGQLGGGDGGNDNGNAHGSGGGGCTVVSLDKDLSNREKILALAAGGGGAGRWKPGDGGGTDGGDAEGWSSSSYGGAGGTQSHSGRAGVQGSHSSCGANREAGKAGSAFKGQARGVGGRGGDSCINHGGGGGGGCGWYGGGGGRGYSTYIGNGGGGGGSSYFRPSTFNSATTILGGGARGGNPASADTIDGSNGKVIVTVLE